MVVIPRRPPSSAKRGTGIVLGIDASYSGLAIVQFDGREFGSVVGRFPGKADWSTAQTLLRVFDIEDWLTGVTTAWLDCEIDAIAMEGYSRGAKNKREESGELAVTVRKAIYEHLGRIPALVAPLQLKKFTTGSTKAEKADMKLHVFKRWGFDVGTDPGGNIADAAGLAMIARALCDGEDGLTGAQKEVLSALGRDTSWRLTRQQLQQMGSLPAAKR
jgi:Holliday junction resolvasome RuvABC endonuclease subunit